MNDLPLVSVILPSYNCERFIAETIESVLRQTYTNFEILAINDGSTDSTVEILESFSDRRVIILNRRHLGVAATCNAGIMAARGNYIAALGSDDIWEPTKLEKQMALYAADPSLDCVYSDFSVINEKGFSLNSVQSFDLDTDPLKAMLTKPAPLGSTVMIKRHCFEHCGLFDSQLRTGEDLDMWVRICLAGYKFKAVREPLTRARIRHESLSRQVSGKDLLVAIQKLQTYRNSAPHQLTRKLLAHATLLATCWMNSVGKPLDAVRLLLKIFRIYPLAAFHPVYLRECAVTFVSFVLPQRSYRRLKAKFGRKGSYDEVLNRVPEPA